MKFSSCLTVATCVLGLQLCTAASAFDLNGAWATEASACKKVFTRKGGTTTFANKASLDNSGVIIANNEIRGRAVRCRITSQKTDGPVIHLLAACSTDIMLSNVQFSVKVIDDNSIVRLFPGMDELTIPYERCP